MKFDLSDWKEFKLHKLFTIKKGKRLTSYDQIDGNNNYIGAIDSNNGVSNHIGQKPLHKGNTISLSYNGSVGEAFYQYEPYWATDDVNALYPNFEAFNPYIGFFICTVLRKEKFKYSYGRKWTLYLMNNTSIKLPVLKRNNNYVIDELKKFSDDGYIPDWQYMENYIKSLHYKPLTTKNNIIDVPNLNISDWKSFKLSDYFNPIRGIRLVESDREKGNIPLVTAGEFNNGVKQKISNATITRKNCITIDMFGNSFYQNNIFSFDDNIIALEDKLPLSKYTKLFLA